MTSKARHRLSEIDEWNLTAYCIECDDDVPISSTGIKNGKEYWRCNNRKKESVKLCLYGEAGLAAWNTRTGCELCNTTENLHIDHDSTTNTFRGILCVKHNTGLGKFNHDPELLRRAADYLEKQR